MRGGSLIHSGTADLIASLKLFASDLPHYSVVRLAVKLMPRPQC